MRVKGHTLESEGAPHDGAGRLRRSPAYNGVGGVGRAKCSCGQLSPCMTSAAQRKRWHKQHKKEASQS